MSGRDHSDTPTVAVAEEVGATETTAPAPAAPGPSGLAGRLLQRKIAKRLQRKQANAQGVADGAGHAIEAAASSVGSTLPSGLQGQFERSLGADLSGVRVHAGERSASAAEAVSARAYTVGQDIHFGRGQYDPSSSDGKHLLAHEVAHTVQQSGAAAGPQHKLEVSEPGDVLEGAADSAADAMVRGEPAPSVSSGGSVQRQIQRTPLPPSQRPQTRSAYDEALVIAKAQGMSDEEARNFLGAAAEADAAERAPAAKKGRARGHHGKPDAKREQAAAEARGLTDAGVSDVHFANEAKAAAAEDQQLKYEAQLEENESWAGKQQAAEKEEVARQKREAEERAKQKALEEKIKAKAYYDKIVALHAKSRELVDQVRSDFTRYSQLAKDGLGRNSEKQRDAVAKLLPDALAENTRLALTVIRLSDGHGNPKAELTAAEIESEYYTQFVKYNDVLTALDVDVDTARLRPDTSVGGGIKYVGANTGAAVVAAGYGAVTAIPVVGDAIDASAGASVRSAIVNSTEGVTGDREMAEAAHDRGKIIGSSAASVAMGPNAAFIAGAAVKGGTEAATGYQLFHEGDENYKLDGWQRAGGALAFLAPVLGKMRGASQAAGNLSRAERVARVMNVAHKAGILVNAVQLEQAVEKAVETGDWTAAIQIATMTVTQHMAYKVTGGGPASEPGPPSRNQAPAVESVPETAGMAPQPRPVETAPPVAHPAAHVDELRPAMSLAPSEEQTPRAMFQVAEAAPVPGPAKRSPPPVAAPEAVPRPAQKIERGAQVTHEGELCTVKLVDEGKARLDTKAGPKWVALSELESAPRKQGSASGPGKAASAPRPTPKIERGAQVMHDGELCTVKLVDEGKARLDTKSGPKWVPLEELEGATTKVAEPEGTARTAPAGLERFGQFHEGVKIVASDPPRYVVYELPDGSQRIRFRASAAVAHSQAAPGRLHSVEAMAGLNDEGRPYVWEGKHRAIGVGHYGDVVADPRLGGVKGAPSYLDYEYTSQPAKGGISVIKLAIDRDVPDVSAHEAERIYNAKLEAEDGVLRPEETLRKGAEATPTTTTTEKQPTRVAEPPPAPLRPVDPQAAAHAVLHQSFSSFKEIQKGEVKFLSRAEFGAEVDRLMGPGTFAKVQSEGKVIQGFAADRKMFINREDADVDTLQHEMMHHNADLEFHSFVGTEFNEGATQYLTMKAMERAGLPHSGAYPGEVGVVKALVEAGFSDDRLAEAYFNGGARHALGEFVRLHCEGSWIEAKMLMKAGKFDEAKRALARRRS